MPSAPYRVPVVHGPGLLHFSARVSDHTLTHPAGAPLLLPLCLEPWGQETGNRERQKGQIEQKRDFSSTSGNRELGRDGGAGVASSPLICCCMYMCVYIYIYLWGKS